uniref:ABC transporter domain-containing protein n=1 Tax=Leersia perrieri TaxID=77586 RepID=A0A0D9VF53_9ORYZ
MTLLLGPPSSGKSTLIRALTGKLDKHLKVTFKSPYLEKCCYYIAYALLLQLSSVTIQVSGNITYCGHKFSEFCPERTSAYVSQYYLHNAEMTVRETLNFSRRCLGIGGRYDMLAEISRRECDAGIKPDPEIDAFMKATAMQGPETNIITDVALKVLALDTCADIIIGDEIIRGISGGQMRSVTTGEMLTGPARALLMDEMSTGLDSASTFRIINFLRQLVHLMISLLQPPPETYNLFDDIVLLSEGYIVYHGPRENILEFFEASGFRCPERKEVADFLEEVTSKNDQQQYWYLNEEPYQHVSVPEFAERSKSFHIGQQMLEELHIPFEKTKTHPAALTTIRNAVSNWELLKVVMSGEKLLMKRNSFLYIFKVIQLIIIALVTMTVFLKTKMPHGQISDGTKFLGTLTFNLLTIMMNGRAELYLTIKRLPVFYKQRDYSFFPAWNFGLANIKVPISLVEATVWVVITYFGMGFAPGAGRYPKSMNQIHTFYIDV